MISAMNYKIGDTVTFKTVTEDGEFGVDMGEIMSINKDKIFILKKFPKIKQFSINPINIIKKPKEKEKSST